MSKQISFDVENAKKLQASLGKFYNTLCQDWKILETQWGNLKQVWHDSQFEKFEPMFNQLSHTYNQAIKECEAYCNSLHQQIQIAESRKVKLEEVNSNILVGTQPFITLVGGGTMTHIREAIQFEYDLRPLDIEVQEQSLLDLSSLDTGINIKQPIAGKCKSFIGHILSQIVPAKTLHNIFIVAQTVVSLVSLVGFGNVSSTTLKKISESRNDCLILYANEQNSLNSCLSSSLALHLSEADRYELFPSLARVMPLDEQLSEAYVQDKEKRQREIEETMRFSNPESQWEAPYPDS